MSIVNQPVLSVIVLIAQIDHTVGSVSNDIFMCPGIELVPAAIDEIKFCIESLFGSNGSRVKSQ